MKRDFEGMLVVYVLALAIAADILFSVVVFVSLWSLLFAFFFLFT